MRNGAPDFLMLKVNEGKVVDCIAVEVKSPDGRLTYEQAIYKGIFERAGVPFQVEVVK